MGVLEKDGPCTLRKAHLRTITAPGSAITSCPQRQQQDARGGGVWQPHCPPSGLPDTPRLRKWLRDQGRGGLPLRSFPDWVGSRTLSPGADHSCLLLPTLGACAGDCRDAELHSSWKGPWGPGCSEWRGLGSPGRTSQRRRRGRGIRLGMSQAEGGGLQERQVHEKLWECCGDQGAGTGDQVQGFWRSHPG